MDGGGRKLHQGMPRKIKNYCLRLRERKSKFPTTLDNFLIWKYYRPDIQHYPHIGEDKDMQADGSQVTSASLLLDGSRIFGSVALKYGTHPVYKMTAGDDFHTIFLFSGRVLVCFHGRRKDGTDPIRSLCNMTSVANSYHPNIRTVFYVYLTARGCKECWFSGLGSEFDLSPFPTETKTVLIRMQFLHVYKLSAVRR